jgi:hypothetical protein
MNIDFEVIEFYSFDYSRILIKIYEIYHKFGDKLGKFLIDKFICLLLLLYEMALENFC